ncbi:DinB family protein [Geminicoccaceae bacterium 1502E]|nr:DinB family protein [Geminicoccaceae bacterium 1502E]
MADGLVSHFRAMARNNAWSNHRLLAACARLSTAELSAGRAGFFPSILLTLNHILTVDRYYQDALSGEPAPEAPPPFAELVPLEAAQQAADRRLMAFCDRLDAAALGRAVTLVRPGRTAPPERVRDVLAHLFLHQIHHRGQLHAMLSGTSVPPPQLDEFFLEDDRERRAPDLAAMRLKQG